MRAARWLGNQLRALFSPSRNTDSTYAQEETKAYRSRSAGTPSDWHGRRGRGGGQAGDRVPRRPKPAPPAISAEREPGE